MKSVAAALISTVGVAAGLSPVSVPPGVTSVGDIGRYRVVYQSYDGDAVAMPPSWVGHFETASGISYMPGEKLLGRDAILLHTPWRVSPGKVWVEYPLLLPETTPITLAFGIAMRPGSVGPKTGDGVTFSCRIEAGQTERDVLRMHYDESRWHDVSFDLSEFAGRQVTLILQTEPGPANNAGFDFSYFGEVRLTVGHDREAAGHALTRILSSTAYQAVRDVPLTRAANRPGTPMMPSNLLTGTNRVEQDGNAWHFVYEGADCRVVYTYRPNTGTLDDLTVSVNDQPPFRPAGGGGLRTEEGHDWQVTAVQGDGQGVSTTARSGSAGEGATATWHFGIAGKALLVQVRCDRPTVTGVSLGGVADADLRRRLRIPYYSGSVDYLPASRLYMNRQWDWTVTNASVCDQGEATYHTTTAGTRNPLSEAGFIVVSPSVHEVFPNLPHPPSPYLERLAPLIMLDIWGHHHDGTFAGDAVTLRRLKDNGIDHLAIIQHVWQRFGYDVKLPDHIPAHPGLGGDAGMAEFGRAANACGYLWSVHENYIDLYPDAPSYDPAARVLRADGTPSPAWFNRGTGVQSYGLKCNRALEFARQNAPEIHRRYATTAAYLDVHTCVPPWHQLDHEAGQPYAAMCRGKVDVDTRLFQYMRDTHGGPLFGEGNNHFYWAGACDGVEAQVPGGEGHRPCLDFDLLKIHPQMVNHGMGYYERWFRGGYNHAPGLDSCAPFQIDTYRAQEIAYGHAGFIGNLATANAQWIAKEHHLMHPIQRLYGNARATRIEYEVDGHLVTASAALAVNRTERQTITYESGLRVWVNWGDTPWHVDDHVLPQWGFLAVGPDTTVRTVRTEAGMADIAMCPEYVFVDARTAFHMPYRKPVRAVEPVLRSVRPTGARTLELTYEWRVGEELDTDYTCFVHFLSEKSDKEDRIVAQNDHALPRPTSAWRKGDVMVDGPHAVELPAGHERFEIVIGLYNRRGRSTLQGINRDDRRYLIGVLDVTPEGIRPGDLDAAAARYRNEVQEADFGRHMNPEGTWIDAGPVATDGSVKVNRGTDRLVLFPYPRNRAFAVEIDPVAMGLPSGKVAVTALRALSDIPLSEIPTRTVGNRVRFEVGHADAGRYVISPAR